MWWLRWLFLSFLLPVVSHRNFTSTVIRSETFMRICHRPNYSVSSILSCFDTDLSSYPDMISRLRSTNEINTGFDTDSTSSTYKVLQSIPGPVPHASHHTNMLYSFLYNEEHWSDTMSGPRKRRDLGRDCIPFHTDGTITSKIRTTKYIDMKLKITLTPIR